VCLNFNSAFSAALCDSAVILLLLHFNRRDAEERRERLKAILRQHFTEELDRARIA
jgi:hypothetical protein